MPRRSNLFAFLSAAALVAGACSSTSDSSPPTTSVGGAGGAAGAAGSGGTLASGGATSGTGGTAGASGSVVDGGGDADATVSAAPANATEARSTFARIVSPQAAPDDVTTLALNDTAFGLDLMRTLLPEGNFIVSPHSISTALAMTYAGARTTTHDEMRSVLRFELPDAQIDPAFDALDLALASRGAQANDAGKPAFELHIANSLWAQKGYSFLPSYLDRIAQYYGAGLWLLDFATDKAGAISSINGWVSEQTNGRIPNLLSTLPPNAKLVLTNAIYFLASWKSPFEKNSTMNQTFTLPAGTPVSVPFMHGTKSCGYAEIGGWQALELDYVGGQLSLVVLLPPAGSFASFAASMDARGLQSLVGALAPTQVQVSLPKLDFGTATSLKPTLAAMGMPGAFDGTADFSGMTGTRDLHIEDVIHQANIRVDEAGTEAAAATAVIMVDGSVMLFNPHPIFNADHPFLFVLRDKPTGAVLFLGQVTDPSSTVTSAPELPADAGLPCVSDENGACATGGCLCSAGLVCKPAQAAPPYDGTGTCVPTADAGISSIACATNGDCPAGLACGYPVADGCAATGVCVEPTHTSLFTPGAMCGCDGQTVTPIQGTVTTDSATITYTSAPYSGKTATYTGMTDSCQADAATN